MTRAVWGTLLCLAACRSVTPAGGDTQDTDPPSAADTDPPADSDDTAARLPPAPCPTWVPPAADGSTFQAGALEASLLDARETSTQCLIVDDLDRDGHVDIVYTVTAERTDPVLVVRWGAAAGPGAPAELTLPEAGPACLAGDLDGDGNAELLLSDRAGLRVVDGLDTRALRVGPVLVSHPDTPAGTTLAMALVDLDHDGARDVVATVSGRADVCGLPDGDTGDVTLPSVQLEPGRVLCYLHDVDAGFIAAPPERCPAALRAFDASFVWQIALSDLDSDNHPEILVAGDFHENLFLRWDGDTGWVDASASSGFGVYNHAMGTAWSDFDGDGLQDVYLTDVGPDQLRKNVGCDRFFEDSWTTGVGAATRHTISWGVVSDDLDHDGDDDVFVSQTVEAGEAGFVGSLCTMFPDGLERPPNFVLVNDGAGRFARVDVPGPPAHIPSDFFPSQVSRGDLDGDGDVDLVTTDRVQGLVWYRNTTPPDAHWIIVLPEDTHGNAVLPARVVVSQGPHRARMRDLFTTAGISGQSESAAHFGLGDDARPLTVQVRWPDGTWTTREGVAADQRLRVRP